MSAHDQTNQTQQQARTLLLRLAGPVQSYAGYRHLPNGYPIPTAPMPRKSAVAGLLGAALGNRDLADLMDRFDLHVRVDRTNAATEDLQVLVPLPSHVRDAADRAEKFRNADIRAHAHHRDRTGAVGPKNTPGTALVNRDFLPHAEFMAAISAPDPGLATEWFAAFQDPTFMTFLGRRANAPTFPFLLGLSTLDPVGLLSQVPLARKNRDRDAEQIALRLYAVTGTKSTHEHDLVEHVTPPLTTRKEQMSWLSQHLSR